MKDTTRINAMMDTEKVKRLDAFAEDMGLTRSAALSFVVSQYFQQLDNAAAAKDMIKFLQSPAGTQLLEAVSAEKAGLKND